MYFVDSAVCGSFVELVRFSVAAFLCLYCLADLVCLVEMYIVILNVNIALLAMKELFKL